MKVNKSYIIFIIIVVIALFIVWINARLNLQEIEKSRNIIVGKFTNIERYPKSRDYFFEFYYNYKKIKEYVKEVPNGFHKNLGKFYHIKYLDKYPNLIIVKFDEEVTDTTKILNAGFSQEDL